ncbi:transglutaminaseTgpA domain-containing protein [Opitutus terrae]|uniref:Transglutaminase domain protein n=1 Tax=Opitutus terrae (strain DSM 11246 / JCM 15787 / PB90-1) TaxID=452637 RepID=B1ZQX6_OPITP|nr:DUF3488 and transglutaminase-like domain-containing protein [Opitutus terrae]ACB77874.1 transglutaminase domain protein [Opitutus terrae PB90-1]
MNKVTAHPQLTPDELQQLRWLLGGALTLLAVSTVFTMDVGASAVAALTLVTVTTATLRPDWLVWVPRWVHRLAFSFVAAFFTADLWLTGELLSAIVRLDALLLLYRGISYRKKRDDLQLIVLGLFLVVLGGVLSVSLGFAVQILAFTAVALVLLMTITLSATEPAAEKRVAGGALPAVPRWARHVSWPALLRRVRQATDWRVVALSTGLFVGLVGLAALLFVTIPRFQLENSFFLERFITKKTRTGFSDTIRFGEVTEITQDNSVALSVDVSDRRAIPADPYWRMLVLDEYRDGTFRLSPGMRRLALPQERGGVNVRGGLRERAGATADWTFYLESGVSRYLPLLGPFELLRFREAQNYRFSRGLGVVELRAEPATMLAYRIEGMENNAVVADPAFAAQWRAHGSNRWSAGALLLQLSVSAEDREKLARAVGEIRAAATPSSRAAPDPGPPDVAEFLRRAEAWLQHQHRYSLSPRIPAGDGDPLLRWMMSSEPGHCELFAGSLVLLARAAGLPARVATGFRGGSWNGYSNNFTLRNSDAHAWCEVFDAQAQAWRRADPTPGSGAAAREDRGGEAGLADRLDRSWTARLDSLRVFWYRRIVSFDQQSQLETLQAVKEATERSGQQLREMLERWAGGLRAWLARPWTSGRMAWLAVIGAGVLVAVVGLRWAARNFRFSIFDFRFRRRGQNWDVVRAEAGRWLTRIAQAERRVGETMQVVAALERLRFGARETWPEPRKIFARARKALREARSDKVGRGLRSAPRKT